MGFILIPFGDKDYLKKKWFCLIQEAVRLLVIFVPFLIILLHHQFDLFTKNIIFASFSMSVAFFLSFTLEDIFARKVSGITMKNEMFLKEYKSLKNMLVNYFLMLFYPTGRAVYVEKNFDGFKKEVIYNTVTSFYIFVILLLSLSVFKLFT